MDWVVWLWFGSPVSVDWAMELRAAGPLPEEEAYRPAGPLEEAGQPGGAVEAQVELRAAGQEDA